MGYQADKGLIYDRVLITKSRRPPRPCHIRKGPSSQDTYIQFQCIRNSKDKRGIYNLYTSKTSP